MRKIHAYRIDDGRIFPDHESAKKAAQRAYDDEMTRLRHDMVSTHGSLGVRESMAAMAWIEENFGKIATAYRLKRDADSLDDMTNPDTDD